MRTLKRKAASSAAGEKPQKKAATGAATTSRLITRRSSRASTRAASNRSRSTADERDSRASRAAAAAAAGDDAAADAPETPREAAARRMAAFLAKLSDAQLRRYEHFRRSHFSRRAVREEISVALAALAENRAADFERWAPAAARRAANDAINARSGHTLARQGANGAVYARAAPEVNATAESAALKGMVHPTMAVVVGGLAKLFAGELVEEARLVAAAAQRAGAGDGAGRPGKKKGGSSPRSSPKGAGAGAGAGADKPLGPLEPWHLREAYRRMERRDRVPSLTARGSGALVSGFVKKL